MNFEGTAHMKSFIFLAFILVLGVFAFSASYAEETNSVEQTDLWGDDTGQYGYQDYLKDLKTNPSLELTEEICKNSHGAKNSASGEPTRRAFARKHLERDECYMALMKQEGQTTLLRCLQLSENKQPLCLKNITIQEDNPEICNFIGAENEKTHANCLTYFAGKKSFKEDNTNFKPCRNIQDVENRYSCYRTTLLSRYQSQMDLAAVHVSIPPTQQKYAKEIKDCGQFESLFNQQQCYHSIPHNFYAEAGYTNCSYLEIHPCKKARDRGFLYLMMAGDKRADKIAQIYGYGVLTAQEHNARDPNYKIFVQDLTQFLDNLTHLPKDLELFCQAAMPIKTYEQWINVKNFEHVRVRNVFCNRFPYLKTKNWYWEEMDKKLGFSEKQ